MSRDRNQRPPRNTCPACTILPRHVSLVLTVFCKNQSCLLLTWYPLPSCQLRRIVAFCATGLVYIEDKFELMPARTKLLTVPKRKVDKATDLLLLHLASAPNLQDLPAVQHWPRQVLFLSQYYCFRCSLCTNASSIRCCQMRLVQLTCHV